MLVTVTELLEAVKRALPEGYRVEQVPLGLGVPPYVGIIKDTECWLLGFAREPYLVGDRMEVEHYDSRRRGYKECSVVVFGDWGTLDEAIGEFVNREL